MAQQTLNNGELGSSWRSKVNANFTELYGLVNASFVQDAAGTTGIYTEETANRLVGHSANTGTSLIFEMFEGTGTPVSVFQIDGNGDIWNNGGNILHCSGTSSLFIGTRATLSGYLPTSAVENVVIGIGAGDAITSGDQNTIVGHDAGSAITTTKHNSLFGADAGITLTGEKNAIFGSLAGADLLGHDFNTMFGYAAGNTNRGDGCIFLGYGAGARQTVSSNMLLIDGIFRASEALELTDSIIYGVMNATVTSQTLQLNAITTIRNAFAGTIFTVSNATNDMLVINGSTTDATFYNDVYANDFILSSDSNLKENIKPLESRIEDLNPVSYNFKGSKNTQYGFVAQDVGDKNLLRKNNNKLALSYQSIIAMLTKEVLELKAKQNGDTC